MAKEKKVPMRMCVGCRNMFTKRELIRIVKSPEGGLSLDFKGKQPGRGAYLCRNSECLLRAKKTRALSRALSETIPEEVFNELSAQMEAAE